jgi:hypothetical protein
MRIRLLRELETCVKPFIMPPTRLKYHLSEHVCKREDFFLLCSVLFSADRDLDDAMNRCCQDVRTHSTICQAPVALSSQGTK